MANQDLDPAAAARVAVEVARYRGRYGTNADSLATPQSDPRARRDVPPHPILGAREKTARCTCEPAVAGKQTDRHLNRDIPATPTTLFHAAPPKHVTPGVSCM